LLWTLLVMLSLAVVLFLSNAAAQEPPTAPTQPQGQPQGQPPGPGHEEEMPDLATLHPLHRACYLSARRGAEWLWQANLPDGKFAPGLVATLNAPAEEEHYLHQAAATASLARSARVFASPRYAARAQQAVLFLLASTKTDPQDKDVRYTVFPNVAVNRVAAAAYLVLAVHELPNPQEDVLEQAEQLARFIHKQHQADGSIRVTESATAEAAEAGGAEQADALLGYQALAVQALMRSMERRPAPWKLDLTRSALHYYRSRWQAAKSPAPVPGFVSAFTDAYLRSKEQPFAEAVFEMADWLCGLQLPADPRQPTLVGGFAAWRDGQADPRAMPTAACAAYVGALAEACRTARAAGDVTRFERYRTATERGLQFLATLQYAPANTKHYADWYRDRLHGAFYTSPRDGVVRLAQTQMVVYAMTQYVGGVMEVPGAKGPARP
jgi:hypothetical protein